MVLKVDVNGGLAWMFHGLIWAGAAIALQSSLPWWIAGVSFFLSFKSFLSLGKPKDKKKAKKKK